MAKRLAGEIEGNKDEIAQLKRKLAEVVSRQPADDWDDPEAGTPAFPSFRGSEDLVLGAFLAKASELLPDSPSPEETSLPLDISPEKPAPTKQTLALETVPPISELDSQEEPTPAPVISAIFPSREKVRSMPALHFIFPCLPSMTRLKLMSEIKRILLGSVDV